MMKPDLPEAPTSTRPIGVLFVNSRSALGADVAVHLGLIRQLVPPEHRVHVATSGRPADAARLLGVLARSPHARVKVLHLGYDVAGRRRAHRALALLGNAVVLPVSLARLSWMVVRHRIDVIHSTERPRDALIAGLLARITRRPSVVHCHVLDRHFTRPTRWGLRRADAVIAVSEFVRRSLVEHTLPGGRVVTVLNGVPPELFEPGDHATCRLRDRIGVAPDARLVGVAGRIMVWKGQLELVQAMAAVCARRDDVHLVIAGSECVMGNGGGGYMAQVMRATHDLGIEDRVHWLGQLDGMSGFYADLDVACVPSFEEPFGLVLVEAMAMGRAIVAWDSGAVPEIAAHRREALLVPPRDVERLADAVIELLDAPRLRQELGGRARLRFLRQFTSARQAEEVSAIYRSVCLRRQQHRGRSIVPAGPWRKVV
jgi:glycosyltransferase involved in cell wall biosynthesis